MKIHGIECEPLDPEQAAEIKKFLTECEEKDAERRRGLIPGGIVNLTPAGCDHQWEDPFLLDTVLVSRCSECFVLGMPPR